MQAFVRWLGFAAAIGAGVLGGLHRGCGHACAVKQSLDQAEMRRIVDACVRTAASVERRLGCYSLAPSWDESLVLRGLIALAVGVALAMVAALIPVPDRERPAKPDVLDAIAQREEAARRRGRGDP